MGIGRPARELLQKVRQEGLTQGRGREDGRTGRPERDVYPGMDQTGFQDCLDFGRLGGQGIERAEANIPWSLAE